MLPISYVSGIGEVYVPSQFRSIAADNAPLKLFTADALGQLNRIFNHLRREGVVVLSGAWPQMLDVLRYVERKRKELVQPPSSRRESRQTLPQAEAPLHRLMCWADGEGNVQASSAPDIPFLLNLFGEANGANKNLPYLIPISAVERLQQALSQQYPIDALGCSLIAAENVLAPRSQETVNLFQEGLRFVEPNLPSPAAVLDMGCGCGCLSLLAAQELSKIDPRIFAADILPEATATTRLNLRSYSDAPIRVMEPGNLFEPVKDRRFDLIVFNAPWVVSRARNRAELAIHDEQQQTLRRFFEQVGDHLNPGGYLLLGYADASGPKAIANLEAMVEGAGFVETHQFKARVATHRAKRKWENIVVYVLAKTSPPAPLPPF